jgi:hypothetical protein
MSKSFLLSWLVIGSLAQAQNQTQVYLGTSPIALRGNNKCQVSVTTNSKKEIVAVRAEGPVEVWEILSEKGGSYGPSTSITYESGSDLISDPQAFARMGFRRKENFWSEGFTLKSLVTAEASIKAPSSLNLSLSPANS